MVAALLCDEHVRLLTLLGAGGAGKSRLAVEVAAQVAPAFPGGVYFAGLAALPEPALLLPAIAQTLAVRESPGQSLPEALQARAQAARMLVLLDNFEHLLTVAPALAALVGGGSRTTLLVTSRAPLRIQGERVVVVPPLALPAAAPAAPAEPLMRGEAMRLFVARAQEANAQCRLTAQIAAAVAEITRRLDGLPLAIELAAARGRTLAPQALLDRLSGRLAVLKGGPRDLPARQRTLRDTIAWSYDLLAADAQALFRLLAVFAGGWTLDALEGVAGAAGPGAAATPGAPGPRPILDLLETLVDSSLAQHEEQRDGSSRFALLETIREYALEWLQERAEEPDVRARHAAWYLRLAEEGAQKLLGPNPEPSYARLAAELGNLRAALAWSLGAPDAAEVALRLAAGLGAFWWRQGDLVEGFGWLARALTRPGAGARTAARPRPGLRRAATDGAG